MEIRVKRVDEISNTTPVEMMFHPLIMEQTFVRNLSEVSNGISVERKHAFFDDFHDSVKKILICVGCDRIRQANSLAFACGHLYCEICSKKLKFCSKCESKGCSHSSIVEEDYSGLLVTIKRLQMNFNVERKFFEMVKFFLTAPYWLKQEDPTMNTIINSPEISKGNCKSSNKFTATGQHLRTRANKIENSRRKSISSPCRSVVQQPKSDSESLFIDSNTKRIPLNSLVKLENCDSYLDPRFSVREFENSPVIKSPVGYRKRAKRKLSKNYLIADETADKRRPKTRKISTKSKVVHSSDERSSSPFQSTKKLIFDEKSSPSLPSSSSTTNAFSENAEGCVDTSSEKVKMTTRSRSSSMEKVKMVTRSSSVEKVKMATRSRSSSVGSKAHEYVCQRARAKCYETSAEPVEMQTPKLRESNSSSPVKIDVNGQQELAKVHQIGSKDGKSVFSLPDSEMEEPVDINLWQHDEKVSRKKKTLMFKSVKERNTRRIFFDGSVKLPSTDDKINVVQLEESISSKQSEASNNIQFEGQKQSVSVKSSPKKKDEITLGNLSSDCRVTDAEEETGSAKVTSSLNASSSSDWVMKMNDESSFVGKSSVSQTCPSKPDVNLPEKENEEAEIQVSSMLVPKTEQSMTAESCPVLSTTNSVEICSPKFDDNSELKVELGLSNENETHSPDTCETPLETASFILTADTTNMNTNVESYPVDTDCKNSPTSIGLVYVDVCKNDVCRAFPSSHSKSVTTNESSSSSIELVEKSSQQTITTISDTVTNGDQNHVEEIAPLIPSQSINFSLPSGTTSQTLDAFKSDGAVEVDVVSYGSFKKNDYTSIQTKIKCAELKKAINDQHEQSVEIIRSSFGVISPVTLSVEKYKGSDSSFRKTETSDAINNSDCETSVLFSTKSSEVLTVPTSRFKSVSCQTTSDLHVSLLRQEFPHLFTRNSNDISAYRTPNESTPTDFEARDNFKTPRISDTSRRMHFTAISSVTSSDRKIFENLFTDRSVLNDSSFHCTSSAEKTVDMSIQPLASPGRKVFSDDTPFTNEKPYANAQLSFDLDPSVDIEEQKIKLDNSLGAASSTPLGPNKTSVNMILCKSEMNKSILKREENELIDSEHIDSSAFEKINGDQNSGNEPNDDMDVNPDPNMVQSTPQISPKAVGNCLDHNLKNTSANNCASDRGTTRISDNFDADDDDDDVEFIAGTPTSLKRCVDDNLEKLMTQSFSKKCESCANATRDDQNDQTIFDNTNSCSQKTPPSSRSLINYSRPPLPAPPVPHLPAFETSDIQKSSLDLFNSTAVSSVPASAPLALVTSGLRDTDVKLVKLFCQRFSVLLLNQVTPATTHLVVKTDRKNRTARTFKYLQAIVNSICVISIEWVQACIDANEILNEEKFIPHDSSGECGPLRAYKSRTGVIPLPLSWLRDYCLFFMEPVPSACTLIQLREIFEKIGATVIADLEDFKMYTTLHHLIIVSDEEESSQTSNSDIANWLQTYRAIAIEFNWLLEVVGRNRVVPFADYELVEIPSDLLLKLNFPEEMLQFEREDVPDSD